MSSIGQRDRPKPQRIQTKFRARAHRENVANNSADSGGRALERFDGAGMIVGFDLERDCPAIADINYTGVFLARFHQNVWSGGRKFFQFAPRILVRTMLAPHHRKNSELGEVRFASEN